MPVLSRVRTRISDFSTSMDAFVTRLGHAAPNLFLWPLLYAVALGSGGFVLRHLTWVPTLDNNKVLLPESIKMIIWVGVALAGLGVFYTVAAPVARRRARRRGAPPPTSSAVVAELNRRLRPLLLLPILPALTFAFIERDSPKETLFLITLAAAISGASVYAWLRPPAPLGPVLASEDDAPPPPRRTRAALGRIFAALAVVLLWAAYGIWFSRFSIINHHALRTATIDLGYYDNIFYQSAHGHPLACSFIKAGYHGSAHFDPILVVLSPLYLLYPRAEFLLVLQAVWLGGGVVPAYLLGHLKLQSRLAGLCLAAMYAVYPALHGANMYEFHSLTLIAPIALWQLYLLESGRRRAYWALLLPTLLVREDIAILMSFVGVYAVLSRRPGWARTGWVTILVCLVYFIIVKRFFMTSADIFMSGKDSYSFAYYYDDLIPNHNGVGGLAVSLLTNPVFVLKTMLSEPKILYVLTLFVPLAGLPLLARPGRVMLVWGMIFCLLASRPPVFSLYFQYSCIIIPVAFALTPAALAQIADGPFVRYAGLDGARFWRALLGAAFVASLLTSWKFGGVLENGNFHGGFAPPARELTPHDVETYTWIRRQVERIPIEDSVGMTNRTGAHAANRRAAYFYPEHSEVDWLFLDDSELHGADLERHNKAVAAGTFELISKHERFSLFRRKKPVAPVPPAWSAVPASSAIPASSAVPAVPAVLTPPPAPAGSASAPRPRVQMERNPSR